MFHFLHISLKVCLLAIISHDCRIGLHVLVVMNSRNSCPFLSTYHRCLHKSSPPLEVGDLYWQLKSSVAKYELLLLRALKFHIQVQLPHPVSFCSQCSLHAAFLQYDVKSEVECRWKFTSKLCCAVNSTLWHCAQVISALG